MGKGKKKLVLTCKYLSKIGNNFFCLDSLPPGRVYEDCKHDCFDHKGKEVKELPQKGGRK